MSQQIIIDYWVEKAREDLTSAWDNLRSGRYQNAEGRFLRRFMDPCSILEVKEIPARKVDEGCQYFQQK